MKGILRIVLFCRDTEVSKEWSERAGFEYLRGYDGMHWFAAGETEVMLHPAREEKSDGPDLSIHVQVESASEMFRTVNDRGLKPFDHQQPGVDINGPVTRPWGDVEFELTDPDGHRWAFTETAGDGA